MTSGRGCFAMSQTDKPTKGLYDWIVPVDRFHENPAHRRHLNSQRVLIVKQIFFLCFKSFDLSGVRCQVSGVRCQVSPVTYHMSLTPTATATDRPPLCTIGCCCWFWPRFIKFMPQRHKKWNIFYKLFVPKKLKIMSPTNLRSLCRQIPWCVHANPR